MIQRATVLALLAGLLASTTGCGVLYHVVHYPLGPGTMCDPEHCPPERDPYIPLCGCGACAPACEPACEPCPEPACGTCASSGSCWGAGTHCGPLGWLFGVLGVGYGAERGCGEIYWGDFHGFPPDCCDPCDQSGNWIGSACPGGACYGEQVQIVGPMTASPGTIDPCATCKGSRVGQVLARDPGYAVPVMRVEPIQQAARPHRAKTTQ